MKPKVIPIVEEKAEISKRQVESGRVRVRKHVEEHTEEVDIPVSRDVVEVRRVPVNRPVDTLPKVRRSGGEIIVPVVEEEVVVTKRMIVKEEIHLITRRLTEHRPQSITLRQEKVEIERE